MLLLNFFIGACFGSFAVLAAERGLQGKSIVAPSSYCSYCERPLHLHEKIPILSYCYLRGQSSCCHRKIPLYSVGTEVLSGLIWLFLFQQNHKIYPILGVTFTALIIIALQDYIAYEFEMKWVVVLCIAIILYSLFQNGIHQSVSLLAGLFTGILFFMIHFFYPKGMGNGDGMVASVLAYALGKETFWFLCFSFIFAGICGFVLLTQGKSKKTKLPLIPFLLLGFILVYFEVHP